MADTLHKEHARFMVSYFTAHGVAAMAVLGDRDEDERRTARERLRMGEVKIFFTCDLYNEGVDLLFVDCLLFLRPTRKRNVVSSATGPRPSLLRWMFYSNCDF